MLYKYYSYCQAKKKPEEGHARTRTPARQNVVNVGQRVTPLLARNASRNPTTPAVEEEVEKGEEYSSVAGDIPLIFDEVRRVVVVVVVVA